MTMVTHEPAIRLAEVDEERSPTARHQANDDWVDDYLSHAPFEDLSRSFIQHAAAQLRLALGPMLGLAMVADLLERLIRIGGGDGEEVRQRINDGDMTLLDDDAVYLDWQEIAVGFAHLFAFARYGEGRLSDPEHSRIKIEGLLTHFRQIVADAGMRAAAAPNFEWLADTHAAAEARWAVDHGRPVGLEGLASLAGVKPKTIANLLASRDIATDGEGHIPAAEALRYLERRKDFVRSTWQEPVGEAPVPGASEQRTLLEQVFVPVDADGNPFLPSLARRGRDGIPRYAIGAKAEPEFTEDYWNALDRLARMPTPRWRRPPASGKGGWSLVSGQDGWRRFARLDLERMIEVVRTDAV